MRELPSYEGVTRFWHPVLAARSLGKKPVRVTVGDRDFALFRDQHGRPAALVDRCPHRFAPLSAGFVEAGRLTCPYHGWNFDREGRGRSPSQPSLTRCDARAAKLVERHGYLWLADETASEDALPAATFSAPLEYMGSYSMLFECPLHVALDNFSEDEHTPWVHTRLGWLPRDASKIEYEARNFDDRTEVRYSAPQRPGLAMRLFGLGPEALFVNEWVTRFDPVRTDYTITHVLPGGRPGALTLRAVIFMVPEGKLRTRFRVFVSASDAHPVRGKLSKLLAPLVVGLTFKELWDDARFVPTVAHTPWSFEGMRLGRFDKPLVHNRKLLERIYLGLGAG